MTARRGETALALYRGLGQVLRPGLRAFLAYRRLRGKEDGVRYPERFGHPSRERPAGPLVWVHAASVGETNAVLPLVEAIAARGSTVLLTTGTVTSAAVAASKLPAGALHQFVPVDVPAYVERFLDHWKPELALFVESEIWPTAISSLAARRIPQLLVNGRLSERSAGRWSRYAGIAPAVFGRLAGVLAQSDADAERFRRVGAPGVVTTGNLKFDVPPPGADAEAARLLIPTIAGRPVWVAASTHSGEEEIVADAHQTLAARFEDPLVTVIVPRHPVRGPAIVEALAGRGAPVWLRSRGELPGVEAGIYVADTLGELGLFYRAAPVAFVGGSLVSHGGQNPIEPARIGAAIVHGPHVWNFDLVYRAFDGAGAAARVNDVDELVETIGGLLAERRRREAQVAAADAVVGSLSGALGRTLDALSPHLAPLDLAASVARVGGRP